MAWKKLPSYIGNIKGWVATIIYTKHSNPDALEALEHDFITNPLTYISHQDQLLKAKEAATEAYALRATQETYLTI